MAQRDQSAMQELLQICCLVSWLLPKLLLILGHGDAMEKVKNMFWMGCLGLKHVFFKLKPCIFRSKFNTPQNAVEFKFRSTNSFDWDDIVFLERFLKIE